MHKPRAYFEKHGIDWEPLIHSEQSVWIKKYVTAERKHGSVDKQFIEKRKKYLIPFLSEISKKCIGITHQRKIISFQEKEEIKRNIEKLFLEKLRKSPFIKNPEQIISELNELIGCTVTRDELILTMIYFLRKKDISVSPTEVSNAIKNIGGSASVVFKITFFYGLSKFKEFEEKSLINKAWKLVDEGYNSLSSSQFAQHYGKGKDDVLRILKKGGLGPFLMEADKNTSKEENLYKENLLKSLRKKGFEGSKWNSAKRIFRGISTARNYEILAKTAAEYILEHFRTSSAVSLSGREDAFIACFMDYYSQAFYHESRGVFSYTKNFEGKTELIEKIKTDVENMNQAQKDRLSKDFSGWLTVFKGNTRKLMYSSLYSFLFNYPLYSKKEKVAEPKI